MQLIGILLVGVLFVWLAVTNRLLTFWEAMKDPMGKKKK